ncbi:Protein phosphatase 2C (PP2C)-like domain [Macleaya cordata]|uniref:Protein phosphatase 2C (PP2C)-like domain n=1 Tax=Macleaya cordata TaxID=56857 RepID=A0A200PSX9_MACCD|nr:Protein phosphatase 2C (PP2C)-like domain [Macleaya cordata]
MGGGFSRLFPCLNPTNQNHQVDLIYTASEPLDETLGHSFCYVRSSARFLSPTNSDRLSPSQSLRLSPSHEPALKTRPGFTEPAFKSISGASVSANTSTPRTVLQHDQIYDDAIDCAGNTTTTTGTKSSFISGFESTSSFSALLLQPIPRGDASGPIDRGFFLSGPIERGALSGPLDSNTGNDSGQIHFSAPLNGIYVKRRRKKGLSGIRKAFYRNLSEKKRPWVVPVLNFVSRKDGPNSHGTDSEVKNENNVQWAHGKAGEDRVHVVVSEEHGWLFVGIYDGFNGPDAPEFLMGNLYRAVFNELEGLFWDVEGSCSNEQEGSDRIQENLEREEGIDSSMENCVEEVGNNGEVLESGENLNPTNLDCGSVKKVTFQSEPTGLRRGKPLWEFLAEDYAEDGLDLSGSDRFAFSVDDALRVSNSSPIVSRRSQLLSKLKHGFSKNKESQGHSRRFFPWRYDWEGKEEKTEVDNTVEERSSRSFRKRRVGPVDHELVLRALSRALEVAEHAYLDMTDKVLDRNPELALMGSCLLVVLMRDEDVYVMNVGDSRAIIGHYQQEEISSSMNPIRRGKSRSDIEGIVEESSAVGEGATPVVIESPAHTMKLTALQLSTDHSTSIEEEVLRIKQEHPDDSQCIVNDRVKGRLKVTRAFGAGFLKQPKLNNALLEMFRNEYIGTAPYISCSPSLRHHKLGPSDQFLVLSSDGLYQYFSNEEVVSHVETFMEKFPDGDPAQHLIAELLFRAAKKAGMDFHELLDIPQGDRRKYHDDVTVMVISLEGRIWKSSGKYL